MLEIKNLTVKVKNETPILTDVSLSIDEGTCIGLTGASGSGKTTLIKSIMGMNSGDLEIAQGQILLDGDNLLIHGAKERRALCGKTIGFIPQNPMTAFFPHAKMERQIIETLRMHTGLDKKQAHALAENAGGWKSSKMRTSTMVTMKGYLPSAWQTAIKPVNKASGTGGGSSSGTETVSDNCFLLAEVEIFGNTTNSVAGEGVQYAYYKAGNSKIKNQNGSAYLWWERSPASGGSDVFCFVYTSGSAGNYYANVPVGVAFCFCV